MEERMHLSEIAKERQKYSAKKIEEVRDNLQQVSGLSTFSDVTVYVVGSYARMEASEYSDIDLFFLDTDESHSEIHQNAEYLAKKVKEIVSSLGFPEADTISPYKTVLKLDHMTSNLGGDKDDSENHFTSRMLLLLESACLHDEAGYQKALTRILSSYFRDFPGHQETFRPVFLANDIMRYWKTLCLNYEHKRYKQSMDLTKIIKHKVRNFKLKMSRMTTCFATLASFTCHKPITEEILLELVRLTPRQRLERIGARNKESKTALESLFVDYDWFLSLTGLPTSDLEGHFANREQRRAVFNRAKAYGDKMFKLLQVVDPNDELIRYLVI
jgi:predicted nucleotidyltransferase